MKTCCACKLEKTPEEFYKNKSRKDGLSTKCKDCSKAYSKEYSKTEEARENNRRRNREYYHREGLAKKNRAKRYGLTVEDLDQIINLGDGRCFICSKKATVIDHNHKTGKVRGHLCSNCNTALGLFGEDENRLLTAIFYLKYADNPDELLARLV